MPKIEFMGHVLSSRGVGPADVKMKAAVKAKEPQTTTEVRSFLGLVNYSARYIPDLATISAPQRRRNLSLCGVKNSKRVLFHRPKQNQSRKPWYITNKTHQQK